MNKEDLTIHSVVRNEPFIYYSIKSIYDYCSSILLYDTGSNDEHTLKDIERLMREDTENKIIFQEHTIDIEEHKWTVKDWSTYINKYKGSKCVGHIRQQQIEDTKTKYFMIVDGDEVHYKETMESILKYNMPEHKFFTQIPLIWFYSLKDTFECYSPF